MLVMGTFFDKEMSFTANATSFMTESTSSGNGTSWIPYAGSGVEGCNEKKTNVRYETIVDKPRQFQKARSASRPGLRRESTTENHGALTEVQAGLASKRYSRNWKEEPVWYTVAKKLWMQPCLGECTRHPLIAAGFQSTHFCEAC